MFSFLFGLGFAVQLIRAEEKGRPIVVRYLWRILLLFLIGVAHHTMVYGSDVVHRYAIAAAPLLLFARLRPALLLASAALVFAFGIAPGLNLADGRHFWQRANPEMAEAERLFTAREQATADTRRDVAAARGGYAGRIAVGVAGLSERRFRHVLHLHQLKNSAGYLCLFILGLWAGRRRILHEPTQHRRLLFGLLGVGWVVGLAGTTIASFPDWSARMGITTPEWLTPWRLPYNIGSTALMLGYLSAVTLLFTYRARVRRLLMPLAAVGRMSLTNYVMQGVMFTALTGNGSLFPRGVIGSPLGEGWRIVLIFVVFATQIVYSSWWFRHFQFGPIEWVWRSLTWFRWQPMRGAPSALPTPAPAT